MRLDRCARLKLHPFSGTWYRALALRYWETRLSADHTRISASRFSAASPAEPGPAMLYLAENHQVAIYEVGAVLGDPGAPVSNPRGSWVLMSLEVRLEYVADLCEPAEQSLIETNDQELTGKWFQSPRIVPTQQLGAALHRVKRLQGVLFPSSKPSGGRNLLVFPEKLTARCRIAFPNELDGTVEMVGPPAGEPRA
jgi:RES domain-containing protein